MESERPEKAAKRIKIRKKEDDILPGNKGMVV